MKEITLIDMIDFINDIFKGTPINIIYDEEVKDNEEQE